MDVTVHCVAWGSGTAQHGQCCIAHLLQDVVALNPHIIFVHTGENDLPHESPSSLCSLYCDLLQRLSSVYNVIIVGQLLPFPRCPRNHPLVAATNEWLAHVPFIQVPSGAIAVCSSSVLLPGSSYQTAFI